MGGRFRGFEFERGRSGQGNVASLVGGGLGPEFARLRWDEREGPFATGGATGNECRCDISCLVVVGVGCRTSDLLAQQPIARR